MTARPQPGIVERLCPEGFRICVEVLDGETGVSSRLELARIPPSCQCPWDACSWVRGEGGHRRGRESAQKPGGLHILLWTPSPTWLWPGLLTPTRTVSGNRQEGGKTRLGWSGPKFGLSSEPGGPEPTLLVQPGRAQALCPRPSALAAQDLLCP